MDRTFKITITTTCTQEFYNNDEVLELRKSIESGALQREMRESNPKSVKKVIATFEVIK